MKKETRGRPSKKHKEIKKSFNKVLEAFADSDYKDERTIKNRKKKIA